MTWEEYKTKREGKKTNNSTTTATETNTWDAYKKKREEGIKKREEERQRKLQEQQQKESQKKTEQTNIDESIDPRLREYLKRKETEENRPVDAVMDTNGNIYDLKKLGTTEIRGLGDTKSGTAEYINGKLENFKENNYSSSYSYRPEQEKSKRDLKKDLLSAGMKATTILLDKDVSKSISSGKNTDEAAIKYALSTGLKNAEPFTKGELIQKPKAFDDGWQVGDLTKTIGGTIGDLGLGTVKGVVQTGENIADLLTAGTAQVADWLGYDEWADSRRQKIASKEGHILSRKIRELQEKIDDYSVIGDTGDKIPETLGYIASIWASGGAGKVGKLGTAAQTATMASSSAGSTFSDSYSKGASDTEAWTKAFTTAAVETASEKAFGLFGKSGLDTGLANYLSGKITSGAGKVFARVGVSATGEMAEEFLSYAGNYLIDNGIIDKLGEADYSSEWNGEELGEQMAVAFLASGITGGGVNTSSIVNNKTSSNTWTDAINETARQQDVNAQQENLDSEIKKLNKNIAKTTDVAQRQEMQNELNWKQKQLDALTLPTVNVKPKIQVQNTMSEQELLNSVENNQETKKDKSAEILPAINEENAYSNKLREKAIEEINNSRLEKSDKQMMLETLDKIEVLNDADMEAIRQTVQAMNEAGKLETKGNYKNDSARRQKYMQYKNDSNSYDSTVVEEVLNTIPENRNGRRTVKQWLQTADGIGKRIANLSNEEIERIAYKSWFDIQPSKSITQYDNVAKKQVGFQKFTSDEWINAINKAVNETRNNQNILQRENKTAIEKENNYKSQYFKEGLDKYKTGKYNQSDNIQVLDKLPDYFYNYGYEIEYPLYLNMDKLKNIQEPKGRKNGKNQHGITMDIIEDLPRAINNPLNIIRNPEFKNRFVVVTDLTDQYGDIVVVPLEINSSSNLAEITGINKITSIYGKETYDIPKKDDVKSYMEQNKDNIVYDIDNKRSSNSNYRLQSPSETINTSNNSITPQNGNVNYTNNYAQESKNDTQIKQNKTMNPTEISNLKLDDANTTPELKNRKYESGNKQSSFFSNIVTDAKFLNEELRQEMAKEDNIRYYKGITNKETLEKAYTKLQKDGQTEVLNWHSKDSKNANAEDVTEGWILLKQYQDKGDYANAVRVAKKMRDIGTTAGQTIQAYNILSRLTPEGMFYYAQSELSEAYNKMIEGKSKKWIEENQSKFDLTPEETQSIMDIMQDVITMEDGYDKKAKIAEVQKIITDKIPPTAGQSIKSWMRISMLFNTKTQVRNVMGNAVVMPVNAGSDIFASALDKLIAKKTGVRTTGTTKLKKYGKGFLKGLYESYNDFRKGVNTRNIEGNRFEVSEGKNFKNKGIGKALNGLDSMLSFALDAGDRGFYEATFVNSINNQLVLNNTKEVTQDMIDIATTEALQRTWQDNNAYTQAVLTIRNILNGKVGKYKGMSYGLGDVLIPFAKTPANLTKAMVDYSPAGLVKTLVTDARKFKNSLENGQYSPQLQHRFVQNLGKGMAGTVLYAIAYALAKTGIATGESDEDKDVKNFLKNSLGISSYSIKIGNKSFTYDWAQPISAPLSIMTNIVNSENKGTALLESVIGNLDTAGSILLEQSFMESLNEVTSDADGPVSGIINQVLELPSRAVPTFSKQIADMVDGTQRTTFEYGRPVKSAVNSIVAKVPGLSKTLPASVDTLGNEIEKYGGNNNIFNVMLNPANTNKGKLSKAGEEIYNVYNQTGDKTIFPRTAPYYINSKGEKITMDAHQRSEFQTISGKYVENSMNKLLNDSDYKKLDDEAKAEIINEIASDSYSKAKYDVLKIDSNEYAKLRETLKNVSPGSYYNYKFKTKDMKKNSDKINALIDADYTNKEKTALYEQYILESTDKKYPIIKETFTENGLNITKYLKYKNQDFSADRKDDGTLEGKSISGSAKQKRKEYIENMGITYTQGIILYGLECTPSDNDKKQIVNYIKTMPNKTNKEKLEILKQFEWITIYKDGRYSY